MLNSTQAWGGVSCLTYYMQGVINIKRHFGLDLVLLQFLLHHINKHTCLFKISQRDITMCSSKLLYRNTCLNVSIQGSKIAQFALKPCVINRHRVFISFIMHIYRHTHTFIRKAFSIITYSCEFLFLDFSMQRSQNFLTLEHIPNWVL